MSSYNVPNLDKAVEDYDSIETVYAGKRCALAWFPVLCDWFTSRSPRNDNNNAEGPWDHWVDLAIGILQDPLTGIVRPEAQAAVASLATNNFYSESNRQLTSEELANRFKDYTY